MQYAPAGDGGRGTAPGREAGGSASRPTPLTLVTGAVAGDSLERVAATVAAALSCPVAIAIPALGEPVVAPSGSLSPATAAGLVAHAAAVIAAAPVTAPTSVADSVAVQIADQIVGIVAAVRGDAATGSDDGVPAGERVAWLEAAAAAASVTALIHDAHSAALGAAPADLLAELTAGPPADLAAFLARGRRLGVELSAGGVVVSARGSARSAPSAELQHLAGGVATARGPGRLLAIGADEDAALALVARLRSAGLAAASATRKHPARLHEALLEAELLAELGVGELTSAGSEETYRLLIGVLLRDRTELEQLRDRTVQPLSDYDGEHDTELAATLRVFLCHDGSTTETAETMRLHRHTVGYRLARVHEVSGLSPYGSGGRERLSLGIKVLEILDAESRLRDDRYGPC
jgi:PucR C-terminal helix-turn-helix domain